MLKFSDIDFLFTFIIDGTILFLIVYKLFWLDNRAIIFNNVHLAIKKTLKSHIDNSTFEHALTIFSVIETIIFFEQ